MKYFILILTALFISEGKGSPLPSLRNEEEIPCTATLNEVQGRSGIKANRYRWKNGLNVRLDEAFTDDEVLVIEDAIEELQSHLCIPITILPREERPKGDYVQIVKTEGLTCSAEIGRQGGKQRLNLGSERCIKKHIIMHELIHSLGFFHEMSRPDRDYYVDIFFENILPGRAHNFDKVPSSLTFGVPYDIHSIMHYGSFAFSANSKPTVLAKNGEMVGDQQQLTKYDIQKLRKMYKCE